MNKQLLSRRSFHGLCVGFGTSLPVVRTMSARAAPAPSNEVGRTVKFRDGTVVPALGQGSAGLAQGRHTDAVEEEALRTGLSLGMTLIDTAELYSDGHSEELIGRAFARQRDRVFVVSKVLPKHATGDGIARACEASLARLNTDHLDLYLLHWRDAATNLSDVVVAFENLRAVRKIRAWGVSNFGVGDMEMLFRVPHGDRCATNQVPYNVGNRGIETSLLPRCKQRGIPVIAYSPLGGTGTSLVSDPTLAQIGQVHNCSAAAVALAWAIRSGNVIAIPESGSAAHVKENAVALSLTLTPDELKAIDSAHSPPRG
jgi:diketogulonate reductase-like aldo/keto reductase